MPRLSRAQLREVDRISIEEYGLPGIVLMENAARAATDVALDMLGRNRRATILCGGGNNGGDGLAIARHMHNRGVDVSILQAWDRPLKGDALNNWGVIQKMGLRVRNVFGGDDPHSSDWDQECVDGVPLLIDALYGTGFRSPMPDWAVRCLDTIRDWQPPVLAIDLPSGMDCDTGEVREGECLRARRTITFAAAKIGFANPNSRHYTGEIIVGDIGCPREILDRVAKMS